MQAAALGILASVAAGMSAQPALAWFHAGGMGYGGGTRSSWHYQGFRGGSASGGGGSWSASGYRGGSASRTAGQGWHGTGAYGGTASGQAGQGWHANGAYGGSASGEAGSGWHATGAYGGTASGYGVHPYGGYYAGYHPPAVVNAYGGCGYCGGWSGGAVAAAGVTGLAAGAAIGAASANAAAGNAYAAGVAAGAAAAPPGYVMYATYAALPAGCAYTPIAGRTYYQCNGVWFQPSFAAGGVVYRVTPAP